MNIFFANSICRFLDINCIKKTMIFVVSLILLVNISCDNNEDNTRTDPDPDTGTLTIEVTDFNSISDDLSVSLSWTNPVSPDFYGVVIVRKTGGYPADTLDGITIYNGIASLYTDTDVQLGTTYYYRAFIYNIENRYSTGITLTATPSCPSDYFNTNNDPTDGCECHLESAVDIPDSNYTDCNCDGIDGEADNGIFVNPLGSDSYNGTMTQPVKTITKALVLAANLNKRDIYLSKGTYTTSTTISIVPSISLYGGYDAAYQWSRNVTNTTTISGSGVVAIHAINIIEETFVNMLTITGTAPGFLIDSGCTGLKVNNCTVNGSSFKYP